MALKWYQSNCCSFSPLSTTPFPSAVTCLIRIQYTFRYYIEQNYGGLHSGSSSLLSRMVDERCMAHKIPSFRIILILSDPFAGNFVTCLNTELLFLTTSEGNIKSVYYLHIYHPPTELWEGNVFSCMCLSSGLSPRANVPMWPLPMMPWTSLYRASSSQTSDLGPTCPQFLDIRPGNPSIPSLCCYWHLVAIIGDLFKHVRLRKPLPRVTSGYGHWRTHSFQVGGTHPTGMLSCLECFRSYLRWRYHGFKKRKREASHKIHNKGMNDVFQQGCCALVPDEGLYMFSYQCVDMM